MERRCLYPMEAALRFPVLLTLLGAAGFGGASCATVKVDSWMNPAYADRPPGKVIVVGVAKSEGVQRQFEMLFVDRLGAAGVEAVKSLDLVPFGTRLTEEELEAKVKEAEADTVIVTRILSEEDRSEYIPGTPMPAFYYNSYAYYGSVYGSVHTPGYVYSYMEIRLETNLYDVKTGDLVWTGRKSVTDQSSTSKNIDRVVTATIGDLRKKGLL